MPTLYVLQPAKANFGIVLAPTHDLHQVVLFVLGNCTVVQVGSARVAVTLASNEIRMHFRTCQHFPHSIFRSHAATVPRAHIRGPDCNKSGNKKMMSALSDLYGP